MFNIDRKSNTSDRVRGLSFDHFHYTVCVEVHTDSNVTNAFYPTLCLNIQHKCLCEGNELKKRFATQAYKLTDVPLLPSAGKQSPEFWFNGVGLTCINKIAPYIVNIKDPP